MPGHLTQLSLRALRIVLTPIARFCLQRAVSIQDILEVLKYVFIDVAKSDLEARGERYNVSKLSAMTGMHRRDVTRLLSQAEPVAQPVGLTSRIMGQWEQDRRFRNKQGAPRSLTCDRDDSEFARLVHAVSRDLHHGTILSELERLGFVEREDGKVRLARSADNVRGNPEKGYAVLAMDIGDLIAAAQENLTEPTGAPNLHARTEYDNVFIDDLPHLKEWLLQEGSQFHKRARAYISKFDADINPSSKKTGGGKVVVGTFGRAWNEGRKSDE